MSSVSVGEIIAEKYRVEAIIASGGMGTVLRGRHLSLDADVAIKLPKVPPASGDGHLLERMHREARTAFRLQSEHVARVLDFGVTSGETPFIVYEHLEGHDLAEEVRRHAPVAPPLAVDWMLEACEAIAEAHALGIVHRDLKPSNLFLGTGSARSTIKVLDFGVAKVFEGSDEGLTESGDLLGSVDYAAPEQLKSARHVTARADIWGLGAILFELVTGRQPLRRKSRAETIAAVLGERAPRASDLMSGLSSALDDVIARCLEPSPEDRFATVVDLAAALAPHGSERSRASLVRVRLIGQIAAGETTDCPGETPTSKRPSPRSVPRALISATAAALSVAILLTLYVTASTECTPASAPGSTPAKASIAPRIPAPREVAPPRQPPPPTSVAPLPSIPVVAPSSPVAVKKPNERARPAPTPPSAATSSDCPDPFCRRQ